MCGARWWFCAREQLCASLAGQSAPQKLRKFYPLVALRSAPRAIQVLPPSEVEKALRLPAKFDIAMPLSGLEKARDSMAPWNPSMDIGGDQELELAE